MQCIIEAQKNKTIAVQKGLCTCRDMAGSQLCTCDAQICSCDLRRSHLTYLIPLGLAFHCQMGLIAICSNPESRLLHDCMRHACDLQQRGLLRCLGILTADHVRSHCHIGLYWMGVYVWMLAQVDSAKCSVKSADGFLDRWMYSGAGDYQCFQG